MEIPLIYREELKEYDFGPGHPFRGDRYEIFPRFLRERLPEPGNYRIVKAEPASDSDLLLICNREYIDFSREYYRAANLGLNTHDHRFSNFHSGDNRPMSRPGKLEEAAALVVGQAKKACDLVRSGGAGRAVSIGGGLHHAMRGWGEGFCIYNDVAFAGTYLMEKCGLERILILDTDAHAGNGTAEYFYRDPRVLFIDLHQDPCTLYPGTGFTQQTGEGPGEGYTVNLPLPLNAGDSCYRVAFEEIVLPLAEEFNPQIIVRNGGSDPHFADRLTSLGLTVSGFRMMGSMVRRMAEKCGVGVVDLIGSGYNKDLLPYAWLALIAGLADLPVEIEEPEPLPKRADDETALRGTRAMVQTLKDLLKRRWKSLAD